MNGSQLTELPDDSEQLRPHVVSLRRAALQADDLSAVETFSDGFLIRFLRARDFDLTLSLKVQNLRLPAGSPASRKVLLLDGCMCAWSWPLCCHVMKWGPTQGALCLSPICSYIYPKELMLHVLSAGQWNPKDWSAFQVFRVSLMTSEIISRETETQRRGLKAIFDLKGWSLGHALQINPSLARKISSVLSDSFPLKVRGIHLVNEPMFFRPVFAMIRPFLPDKIKQRVHMHGTDFHRTLSDFFSPDVLPPEYGGEGLGIEEVCQAWTQELFQSESLLKQIASHPTGDISTNTGDALISQENETMTLTEG
ncbi:alpha-tocopherol transfer protein [Poecilia reticulata]|uniref:alpha-tocopherol transfer protein n=1 Tax=Poecilia reticulata TaxID=8081 RepID=UPI0007EBBF01|nr:PREDICTED: alpha-tocopherol transfer protein [Poecilia reticulata]